ncbi:MAG: tetratricopeptide repeat protein [Candidatus Sulfotelmatobacter sp.]|jgi:tetratricopeptide (TPR) repeat protein
MQFVEGVHSDPKQALFAQRRACLEFVEGFVQGIWASPAKYRAFCGITIARLAPSLLTSFSLLAMLSLPLAAAETPQELLAAGRVDQALQALQRQIQTTSTAETYNLLCRAHFELDAWDAGIPACEKAVSLAPDTGLYHLWLGRIYGENADRTNFLKAAGLAKKVHTEFERAVALDPTSWEARTDLAEFYLEAPAIVGGGEDKARSQADALFALNPGMAHWVRARLAQKNKDMVTAEQEYRAAIDASHGGARAWVNLAGFYRHTNRLEDMERALLTMESRPIDRPAALMDAAGMLFRTGRADPMAMRLVRRYLASATVEEWPAFKAHNLLGELLEKQGDFKAAAEEYRSALSMAHTFNRAREGLQRVGR